MKAKKRAKIRREAFKDVLESCNGLQYAGECRAVLIGMIKGIEAFWPEIKNYERQK